LETKVHAEPQIESGLERSDRQYRLRAFGLVLLCLLAVLGAFYRTFVEMVQIWGQSQTYSHGYLVLPIFLVLVWQRSAPLAAAPIQPFVPAFVPAIGAGFLWLLGELASALALSFFAMIAMVPLTVAAVLGLRWARVLAFPFAILFFAVPFGEAFVPTLMQWTADFTVTALKLSGVPVYREGQNFVIPSGNWSVVEACSGVRYLIASLFVGALYAWQMYRSPLRRAAFLLAAVVVPIVANWLRAYFIVMLGHFSDNRIAAGVDHLIYGWIFFGIVIAIMFAVGAAWREDDVPDSGARASATAVTAVETWPLAHVSRMAALMLAVLFAAPVAAAVLMQPLQERALPDATVTPASGWTAVTRPLTTWRPHLQAPAREQLLAFEKDGRQVGVYAGFFRNQRQGAELVSSVNQLAGEGDTRWQRLSTGVRTAELNGKLLPVHMESLRGVDGTIVAWRWYGLDGVSTASDVRAKFQLAIDRLLRRDDTSAWLAIFVVNPETPAAGDLVLAAFAREMGAALERGVLEVAGR